MPPNVEYDALATSTLGLPSVETLKVTAGAPSTEPVDGSESGTDA
jgi:hypothetical protein